MTKKKTYTYPVSASWTDVKLGKMEYVTQLYSSCGVYCALYHNGRLPNQMSWHPRDAVKFSKQLKTLEKEGRISNLVFGENINVSSVNGFWEQV